MQNFISKFNAFYSYENDVNNKGHYIIRGYDNKNSATPLWTAFTNYHHICKNIVYGGLKSNYEVRIIDNQSYYENCIKNFDFKENDHSLLALLELQLLNPLLDEFNYTDSDYKDKQDLLLKCLPEDSLIWNHFSLDSLENYISNLDVVEIYSIIGTDSIWDITSFIDDDCIDLLDCNFHNDSRYTIEID